MSFGTVKIDIKEQLDWTVWLGAPAWVQSTLYVVGSRVYNDIDDAFYRAIRKHTSTATGALLDTSEKVNWEEIEDGLWLIPGDTIATVSLSLPTGVSEVSLGDDGYAVTMWLSTDNATPAAAAKAELIYTTINNPSRETRRKFTIQILDK